MSPGRHVLIRVGVLDLDARVGEAARVVGPDDRRDRRLAIGSGGHGRLEGTTRSIRCMEVTVRLFAMLRERAGPRRWSRAPGRRAGGRRPGGVQGLADGLPLVMAVNREYADAEHTLAPGDELALIPPVSGGETSGSVGRRRPSRRLPHAPGCA